MDKCFSVNEKTGDYIFHSKDGDVPFAVFNTQEGTRKTFIAVNMKYGKDVAIKIAARWSKVSSKVLEAVPGLVRKDLLYYDRELAPSANVWAVSRK